MRRKVISLYERECAVVQERIKEQLTELYSSPIERFYEPYKNANLMLRNKFKECSSRRKSSSICVSNALKTAKMVWEIKREKAFLRVRVMKLLFP